MPDYLGQLRNNGELMAVAAERDLDALDSHVPSCPEWNVGKLIVHTGQHHRWVADAIRRAGAPPDRPGKPGLRGAELVGWFRDGWSELADLLGSKDDEEPAWTWSKEQKVGFWRRRTALETLVHRWDAENATGETTTLDPDLSSDGVDEMLFVMIAQGDGSNYRGASGSVALATTDTDDHWAIDLRDAQPVRPERARREADLRLSAPAADLLLYLWGRVDGERIAMAGDEELRGSFSAWVAE